MKRLIALAFGLLALCGMARGTTVPIVIPIETPAILPEPTVGSYGNVRTVAVISLLGDKLQLINRHSFFGTKAKDLDASGWQIDKAAVEQLKLYLSSRFSVVDAGLKDRLNVAAFLKDLDCDVGDIDQTLRKHLPGNSGVDAFIIIRPAKPPMVWNCGLALEKTVSSDLPYLIENYEIDVVDAHSLAVIGRAFSRYQVRAVAKTTFAVVQMDKSYSLSDDLNPDPAQIDRLRAATMLTLRISLLETIRVLGLGLTLPDVGAHSVLSPEAKPDPFGSIKSLAIVSAFADTAEMIVMGSRAKPKSVAIDGLRLDGFAEAKVRSALAKWFTIKSQAIERSVLTAQFLPQKPTATASITGLPVSADVDAYVVLLKQAMPLANGITAKGIGVRRYGNRSPDFMLHCLYAIAVIDAKNLNVISVAPGIMNGSHRDPMPDLKVNEQLWVDPAEGMTTEAGDRLRRTVESLLGDSVPETLYQLGLLHDPAQAAAP